VHLRRLTEQDLDMILAWRNAPAVRQNMYTSRLISLDEHRAWFERLHDDDSRQYFIFERDGVARGVVGFTQISRASRRASWAFYASPDAPRGTGSLMEFCALEHAFSELALHRLDCEVLDFNLAVVRLHQTFGFKVEGTLRAHHFDGTRYCDVVLLGILEEEWDQQRGSIRQRLRLKEVTP
jgi:UDP-4-amino-4,6-dideoxy-N-acetyl-beta-L-altrosamine N-acetyltransferase